MFVETTLHFIMRSACGLHTIFCVSAGGTFNFWGSKFNYMDIPENGRCNDHSVNERHYDTAGRTSVAL